MENDKKCITLYIGEKDSMERKKLVCFLEEKGFSLDAEEFRERKEIIDGTLPIVANMEEKTYQMMGNVTSAAGAAASGVIIQAEEFYGRYTEICV